MSKTKLAVEEFTSVLRNNIEGDYHDPLLVALLISNIFGGEIFISEGDFMVKIGLDFYNIDGLMSEDDVYTEELIPFSEFSALQIADEYNDIRTCMILSNTADIFFGHQSDN